MKDRGPAPDPNRVGCSTTERAYERRLPGGGCVALDVCLMTSSQIQSRYHGTLMVERRSRERFDGDAPVIIAEATGTNVDGVLRQLLPIAQSNPAIAAALLARDHARSRRNEPAISGRASMHIV